MCATLAISENLSERPLNSIETSRALNLLASAITDKEVFYKTAEGLGLPCNPSLLKKIEPLCRLPQVIQNGILSGNLAQPVALMLDKLPSEAAIPLSDFLTRLTLSLQKQREFVAIIHEISIRDGCPVQDVIQAPEILDILGNPEPDIPRKANLIRNYLKRRRYPLLSNAQDSFDKIRSSLNLGENTTLTPPPGFESNRFTLTFTFSKLSDLDKHKQTIERLSRDVAFQSLLESRDIKNH